MSKIVAIGGGEIGRPGHPVETTEIDREIMRLAGRHKPRLLFIPTASSDGAMYAETARSHFGQRLGCEVDELLLIDGKPSSAELEEKIAKADIVYVGGGDTLLMMQAWLRHGVDRMLRRAYDRGCVMAGLSAGSICWFEGGLSDTLKVRDRRAGYVLVRGLGFIPAIHCPHYDVEAERRPALRMMMAERRGVAIALGNCAALEVVDGGFRILSSRAGARAFAIFHKQGAYKKIEIRQAKEYQPLGELLNQW